LIFSPHPAQHAETKRARLVPQALHSSNIQAFSKVQRPQAQGLADLGEAKMGQTYGERMVI
jgi:hypothetical protein